jgi:eukaryotic-like serine/threonine-protein kinase
MASPATQQTIEIFGKYDLLERFVGGMADVFRARDQVTGKIVAVKILKPEFETDEDMKKRFLDEARTAARLQHPHLVDVFDFGEYAGRTYIVMEFLRGQDLRAAIRNRATGDLVQKLQIVLQIAEAIEYIHSENIVHRDIKPENIHIDLNGVVRLIDFGVAKSEAALHKTQVGFAVGTLLYMAPEQLRCEPTTNLVDVYAFGMVLYELFTSQKALKGQTDEQLCFLILNEQLNLDPLRSLLPEPLVDLIGQCVQKDPQLRPQNFSQIRQTVQQILVSLTPASNSAVLTRPFPAPAAQPPAPVASRRTLPRWAYAVIVGVAAIAIISGLILARAKDSPLPPPPVLVKAPVSAKRTELPRTLPAPAGDMVLVPAGQFLFGEHKEKRELPAFYIDRTEVTNAAYSQYASATGVAPPIGRPEYPRVHVTAAEAGRFCEWAGKRLPTMYEWEKAARGTDGRDFPWGDQLEPSRANVSDHGPHTLMPAIAFAATGASPYGALQMAGNVWEYISDTRQPTVEEMRAPHHKGDSSVSWPIIYGGSFHGALSSATSNAKSWDNAVTSPSLTSDDIGFRCAKTAAN